MKNSYRVRHVLPCVAGTVLVLFAVLNSHAVTIEGGLSSNKVEISWTSTPPLDFDLLSRPSLTGGGWTPIPASNLVSAVTGDVTSAVDLRPLAPSRFYRALLDTEIPLCTNVCFVRKISLLDIAGRSLSTNVLKLFKAAVDPASNRLFVSGIMTKAIGVLDTESQTWDSTWNTMDTGWKYLWVDATNRFLYNANATSGEVRTFDLDTRALRADTNRLFGLPTRGLAGSFNQPAIDTKRGRFILGSSDPPYLLAYDGASLCHDSVFTNGLTVTAKIGKPLYDPAEDVIYAFEVESVSTNRNIYRIHPLTGATAATLSITAPGGQRIHSVARNVRDRRFHLLTQQSGNPTNQTLIVVNNGGVVLNTNAFPVAREVQDMVFDPVQKKLVFLTWEHPTGAQSAKDSYLDVIDPVTMSHVSSTQYGRKASALTYDSSHNRVYSPNGDASMLWSFDASRTNAVGLRIGDSIDQVVPIHDTGTVFINSRLGGSYLLESRVTRYEHETFTSGTWPIPIRVDSSGERLYVLNAWDSVLSIYGLGPSHVLITNITLHPVPGTTDRIPDLAVDSSNHFAFVAYPEFAKLTVVDTTNHMVIQTETLPMISEGESPSGAGQLDIEVNETLNRLYVFNTLSTNLTVFTNGPPWAVAPPAVHLSSLDWTSTLHKVGTDLLFRDEANDRLFAGPFELNPVNGSYLGEISIGDGLRLFAYDSVTDCYWALGVEDTGDGDSYFVVALDRASLAIQVQKYLPDSQGQAPRVGLDVGRRLLYVGHLASAELYIYAVTSEFH